MEMQKYKRLPTSMDTECSKPLSGLQPSQFVTRLVAREGISRILRLAMQISPPPPEVLTYFVQHNDEGNILIIKETKITDFSNLFLE